MENSGFLAVEFFFGKSAFVAELLKLAQLIDNAVLGIGRGVIRRVAAGVAAAVGSGPNEANDPANKGPAQKKVDGEDAAGAAMAPHARDDRGKKIKDQADAARGQAEKAVEIVKRKVDHSDNKFTFFLLWTIAFFLLL